MLVGFLKSDESEKTTRLETEKCSSATHTAQMVAGPMALQLVLVLLAVSALTHGNPGIPLVRKAALQAMRVPSEPPHPHPASLSALPIQCRTLAEARSPPRGHVNRRV